VEEADSPETYYIARSWLKQCLTSHPKCGGYSPSSLPTRVIEVGEVGSNTAKLRVVDPSDNNEYEYFTLSYCLGKGNEFITTPDCLVDRQRGFLLSELPKTIRDAVLVTHEFGVPYLWVDRLYVLQGTSEEAREDWLRESSKMADVYSKAKLTIVASWAESCQEDIFRPRKAKLRYMSKGSTGTVDVSYVLSNEYLLDGLQGYRYYCIDNYSMCQPIHERGWTLQERLLSRRILTYSFRHMCLAM
jgi:Heterokaryon incompatibility protein (HET)